MDDVQRLIVAVEAKLDRYVQDMSRMQSVTNQRLGAVEQSFNRMAKTARVAGAAAGNSMTAGMSTYGRAALQAQLNSERLISSMSRFGGVTAPGVERATVGAARATSDFAAKTDDATRKTQKYSKSLAALDVLDARGSRSTRVHADDTDHFGASLRKNRGELKASTSAFAAFLAGSTGFGTAITGIGLNIAGIQLLEYANAWKQVSRSIDAGQQTFGVALKGASELTDLANEARVDLDAYSALFIRTTAAIRDYGMGADTAATVTSTLAKALKLGSASAGEQASVLLQFSQALQKGKLDGDEFKSVMENAGVVQELLAERLRVSKGEIIALAGEGKLKIADLIGAMTDGAGKVDRIFEGMPATIDEAFAVMRNNVVRYIGQVDESTGVTNKLSSAMGTLARNMDDVAASAAMLGAAILASFAPRALVGVLALASRLLSLPGILAAVSTAALTFGGDVSLNFDRMNAALSQGADLASAVRVSMSENSATATTVSDQFRGLASVLGQDLTAAVTGISQVITGQAASWGQLQGYALIAIGAIIGGIKSLGHLAYARFHVIPAAGKLAFQGLYNVVAETMQSILDTFAEAINRIIALANTLPGIELGFTVAPQIGTYDTAKTRGAMEEISKDLQSKLEQNFDLKGFASRVQKEADQIAFDRTVTKFRPQSPFTDIKGKPPSGNDDKDGGRAGHAFERDLLRAEQALQMRKLDQDSIGRSTYETERLRVQTELLNAAREAGVSISEADRIKIDAISQSMAVAVSKTDDMRAAYQTLADESKAFFGDLAKGMMRGQAASELLASGLDRIAGKLMDMAVNDMVELALGGLTGRSGSIGGAGSATGFMSGLAGLFGGGSLPTTAGTGALPAFAKGGITRGPSLAGEAGPEAVVPLSGGRSIPVSLRMPSIPRAVPGAAGAAGGKILVTVAAGPELMVTIRNEAMGVVTQAAPAIVSRSVQETNRNLPGMINKAQKRTM